MTATLTLTDFLLARIAEDEADLRLGGEYMDPFNPPRLLAECEAKRRIVERYARKVARSERFPALTQDEADARAVLRATLLDLAMPYADHEDFQEEWRV